MCLPGSQQPNEHLPVSDEEEEAYDEQSDGDIDVLMSDNDSSSDSSIDNCSLNSWINEHDHSDIHNSDSEFDPSEHTDDDISMSDDSDDLLNEQDNEVPNLISVNGDDDDDDDIDEEEDEELEEDDVVEAYIAATSSDKNRNHPPNLSVGGALIGGFSFNPNTNVIAIGLSNGDITMYRYSNERNVHLRTNDNVHLKKIMVIEFNDTGDYIYTACKDNNVSMSDVETGKMKVYIEKAHSDGSTVTTLSSIDENTFATADDDGIVNVWDVRANGCRFSLKKNEDGINSMISVDNSSNQPTLVCASGDGTLSVIDISSKKMVIQSEPYKSSLNSCVTMKRKTKLICGTGEGSLITFNTGDCSMYNDEFPCIDKGTSVNQLVPVTENIVISALDNGKIRATNLFPNCHLGMIGQHRDTSVDLMDISDNGHLIASSGCFSNAIKFWNIEFFVNFDVKKHFKKINPKDFNLPSSNVVNTSDFFSGLQ